MDLGDSSSDYEACGNCPGVVAPGRAPGGCRSEATTALYALSRIQSPRRGVSPRVDIHRLYNFRRALETSKEREKKRQADYDDRARNYCESIPRSRLTSDIDDKTSGRSTIVTLTQIMGALS